MTLFKILALLIIIIIITTEKFVTRLLQLKTNTSAKYAKVGKIDKKRL